MSRENEDKTLGRYENLVTLNEPIQFRVLSRAVHTNSQGHTMVVVRLQDRIGCNPLEISFSNEKLAAAFTPGAIFGLTPIK